MRVVRAPPTGQPTVVQLKVSGVRSDVRCRFEEVVRSRPDESKVSKQRCVVESCLLDQRTGSVYNEGPT